MCSKSSKSEDVHIWLLMTWVVSLILVIVCQAYSESRINSYKRAQQCIQKHEASKQVCNDLYL